jgi:hypothetical protein
VSDVASTSVVLVEPANSSQEDETMTCIPDAGDWAASATPPQDALHEWILSLPWVVERHYPFGVRGVRIFAVDCALVDTRAVWLVTGLPMSSGLAVVVPLAVAEDLEILDLAESIAPMPAGHVLASLCVANDDQDVERVVLAAYAAALA